jgi:hypothetical protein
MHDNTITQQIDGERRRARYRALSDTQRARMQDRREKFRELVHTVAR